MRNKSSTRTGTFRVEKNRTMSEILNTDTEGLAEILKLDPEGLALTTVLATKIMLIKQGWSKTLDNVISGNLTKRVSFWHEFTLDPLMKSISRIHTPPSFARHAILLVKRNTDDLNDGDPTALHVWLLLTASNFIQRKLRQVPVGPNTQKNVAKWFDIMSATAGSSLFEASPANVRHDFSKMLQKDKICGAADGEEYLFFDPESLFIKIAHMIYFYTTSGERARLPSTSHAFMKVTRKKMWAWEHLSGDLLVDTLGTSSNGLHNTDLNYTELPNIHLSFMKLPYKELKTDIERSRGLPSVTGLHESVMQSMCTALNRIIDSHAVYPTRTKDHFGELRRFFVTAHGYNRAKLGKLRKREKTRRHYVLNLKDEGKYQPHDPSDFQRDIFIAGRQSYFFIANNPAGRAELLFRIG